MDDGDVASEGLQGDDARAEDGCAGGARGEALATRVNRRRVSCLRRAASWDARCPSLAFGASRAVATPHVDHTTAKQDAVEETLP